MDLISAKVEAARESKSGKLVFIAVDAEGEATVVLKHPGKDFAAAAYKNGSEISIPDAPEKSVKAKKENKAKEAPTKKEKVMKTMKKKTTKKIAAKPTDRKAVTGPDAIKRLVAAGAKKVTLSISKAIERSKKATLYRASNGSPLGKYYLADYKDKTKEIEFLVKDR